MTDELYRIWSGEHTFVYRFRPNQAAVCMRRVYVDSRHPTIGFSLALVFRAMVDLS